MDSILFDLRYAARRLRHSPAFTLVVVLTLALGIGANSAIFSVINTVLLRPLPYNDPGRLVTIYHYYPRQKMEAPVSAPGFKDYRDRTHDFESVAVENNWNVNLTGVGEPERLQGSKVSALFFPTLAVAPLHGRVFRPDEDAIGHNHEVVLSYGLWQRDFGGELSAIGKQASFNGESYDIVGVMPPGFVDPWSSLAELWTPLALDPALFVPRNYTNEFMPLTARLKPGVTIDQAVRDMTAFAETLRKENPDRFSTSWTLEVKSLNDVSTGPIRPALLVLLGAVGFVLLIACANVANLMLARAAARHKEVAIRTALGADRWSLVKQLLTESVMLSMIGGAVGLLLAYASIRGLVAMNPGNIPGIKDLTIDMRVMLFTLVISLVTGVVFGLVPALQTSRENLHVTLKEGGRSGTADRNGQLLRRVLVVSEVALALTLLAGGGLLVRSFAKLQGVDPGFKTANVLTFGLALPAARYKTDTAQAQFYDAVIPRIAQVPGVKAAGATSTMPFGGGWSTGSFNVEGFVVPPKTNGPWGDIRAVAGDFFGTMQIPLIRGRVFNQSDAVGSLRVVVVDEEFVRQFYKPGEDPIGKRMYFENTITDSTRFRTIIGVVGHTKHEGLDAAPRVQLYFDESQAPFGMNAMQVAVRTSGDPKTYVTAIRNAIHEVDHDMPMSKVSTLDVLVDNSMGQRRLSAVLLGVFAGLALLLASIGIYGVMSYTVAQRTRELGVRVALGASTGSVLSLVMRQGMTITLIGVGIGLAGAFGLTRLIATQLFSVKATDPATFLSVTGVLVVVAVAATLVPALRATRIDPLEALRQE
ncbi:MAG TPA: ABC transporter permease [Gemmatimonadaceae bacterium]|jgi:putative ABC transport system permease protein|nr:ABC transporter permease [Gemmatimonadaceae bacterium]